MKKELKSDLLADFQRAIDCRSPCHGTNPQSYTPAQTCKQKIHANYNHLGHRFHVAGPFWTFPRNPGFNGRRPKTAAGVFEPRAKTGMNLSEGGKLEHHKEEVSCTMADTCWVKAIEKDPSARQTLPFMTPQTSSPWMKVREVLRTSLSLIRPLCLVTRSQL